MKTFALISLVASLATTCTHAFQFMKDWKVPVHDPHEQAVKERFGDKSTYFWFAAAAVLIH